MTDRVVSRRSLLGYTATAAAGAGLGALGGGALTMGDPAPAGSPMAPGLVSPYGNHQAGIALPTPEVLEAVAFDLAPGADSAALGRLMRSWTGSIESLTAGRGALGDPAPWLADAAARLTVTVGWGVRVVGRLAAPVAGFAALPPLNRDRLDHRWSDGDLLLLVGARDGTTAAHAIRRLTADAAPFATVRWRQSGTWNTVDADGTTVTGRNLFGQVDGSGNPAPGSAAFDQTVWIREGPWAGGTTLALRRIRMDLEAWEELTRDEMENAVGRRLTDGAPLTGGNEFSNLDLVATEQGRPVIPRNAHARLAHPSANSGLQIFRKGANYVTVEGTSSESGLIFQSYQARMDTQLVPMLERLDVSDALNEWTTTVGSAAFAVVPGFRQGGWLGDTLLRHPAGT